MSIRSSGRLEIPQWAVVPRTVTARSLVTNEYDVEQSSPRRDLTTGVVHFTAEDDDGNVIIQKTSAVASEILILDQLDPETTGQAKVFFLEADTAALVPGDIYWFDCWLVADGVEEPIVDKGRFIVLPSVTHVSAGPVPSTPVAPAPQIPQIRSFRWVAPSAGNSFTVAIPGTGMVNNQYHVGHSVRSGVIVVDAIFDETLSTPTQFQMTTAGTIPTGTVITFILRGM